VSTLALVVFVTVTVLVVGVSEVVEGGIVSDELVTVLVDVSVVVVVMVSATSVLAVVVSAAVLNVPFVFDGELFERREKKSCVAVLNLLTVLEKRAEAVEVVAAVLEIVFSVNL
jgi:flagellar motor component MotA